MDARRIVLRDAAGSVIRMMDVSDIDNANSQCSLTLTVETRCDLGDWHQGQDIYLAVWGRAIRSPYSLASPAKRGNLPA